MPKRSIATVLVTASALVAAAVVAPATAQASPTPKVIPNTTPTWLAAAQNLGHAGGTISARVYLAPKGGLGALQSFALAASTPGTAAYGHYLSPAQFHARFDAPAAAVSGVRQWLTQSGLSVTGVEAHNRYLSVTGSVAAAEKAFGTRINRYRHDGQSVQAQSGALRAPAGVAASVLAISGVDTTPAKVKPAQADAPAPPPDGFRNARPCSAYYGEQSASTLPQFNGATLPYAVCGYTGSQFRGAYERGTELTGEDVTVAITDAYAAPTIAADAATYARRHGDRRYDRGQLTQVLPKQFTNEADCGASGWYGEETLDVEAVHAMAPEANIRYYASASCFDSDFLDTLARVNDEGKAQIVSNSWGEIEQAEFSSDIAAYEAVFAQGAAQGISFVFSSGDNGDELDNSGTRQADFPAVDPWVTAVGGTSTAINGRSRLAWQTGWGTHRFSLSGGTWGSEVYLYGAGGGESTVFGQPAYQAGVVPAGNRQVPDVAMDADPTTGMLVGETQTFPDGVYYDEYRIGGTSLAAPLFAGMTALAFERNDGRGAGLLNPVIYQNSHSGVFTDVKGPGPDAGNVRADYINGVDASNGLRFSVRTFNQDSSLTTAPGWDNVTGLGSPNTRWLSVFDH